MIGKDRGLMPDEHEQELLREFLAERDTPCPRCAYNIRALTGSGCPECGSDLELRVGLVEPRLGAYIALLVACCLGFGASALLGMVALVEAPGDWFTEPAGLLLLGQWCLSSVALPLVLRHRRKLRKMSDRNQWGLAMLAWAVILGLSAGIVCFFD